MTTNELIEALEDLDADTIKAIAEKAKPLQKHIDRRVSGAIIKAKETTDDDPATALDAKAKALDRKETVLSLAIERGIDPKAAFSLLGIDSDSTDEDRLDAIAEYAEKATQDTKDQILKNNTRTPRISQLSTETSDEHILANPEHYPSDIVNAALERGLEQEREKRTLRSAMGGGR